ncbi:MAG: hypothetical protein QGG14_10990 [Planctomycetota bacterium]|nr:hypothetical protein [Planctomycetota bacterium]
MNPILTGLALSGALVAPSLAMHGENEVALTTKVYRSWKIRLPAEGWRKVGKAVQVASWDKSFAAKLDGTSLRLDTDADGEVDTTIDKKGGVVLLTHGKERLALRLRSAPDWSYAPASVKVGEIEGKRVRLIDQNNNGRFDDFGADAMVIGRGKAASFLSKVVRVDSKLFEIGVSSNGGQLTYKPYEGPTSQIDFKVLSKGKILAAVLKSTNGDFSFDVSNVKKAITIPTASYRIHSGLLSFGGNKVSVRSGSAKAVALTANASAEIRLGGPARVEFAYETKGGKYHFAPDRIWYFGRAGEEYYNWQPLGKSPLITIDDALKNTRLAEVIFPPNC